MCRIIEVTAGLAMAIAVSACSSSKDDAQGGGNTSSGGSAGSDGQAGAASCALEPASSPPADVTGRWAALRTASRVVQAPGFAQPFHTIVVSLLLVDQTQTGTQVVAHSSYCDHTTENPDSVVNVIVPAAYLAALPGFDQTGSYEVVNGVPTYRLSRVYEIEGAQLVDPVNDALPTSVDDPRVYDQDGDGKPGMTLRLTGLVDGEIYIVERQWTEVEGVATAADRLDGRLPFVSDQVTLASDPTSLKDLSPVTSTDPDECASSMRMVRVGPSDDCASIISRRAELFP